MMINFGSLYSRLTLVMIALFTAIGLSYLALVSWSNYRYYQETTQSLNKSLAMYIAGRAPLIRDGQVNKQAMKELAELVMVVNPIVEVYLVDTSGRILAHALPAEEVVRSRIDLQPVKAWLEQKQPLPIIGTDPRSQSAEKVFSAWPIDDHEQTVGYLYVVLEGATYQSLRDSLRGSYALQLSLSGLIAIVFFAALSALIIFGFMTRPLRRLAQDMEHFQSNVLQSPESVPFKGDELQYLRSAFDAMKTRIRDQMANLEETDRVRRELISNVSHDLRTPLASMQGYLETLALKTDGIDDQQRHSYLEIAHKHCLRLTQLVQELFELSKLDAGRTPPHMESFSLAELLQDVSQKFSLQAQEKQIQLEVKPVNDLCSVQADIALIERVIENLIDNAIHYTPVGGAINLALTRHSETIEVQVIDTGTGVPADELPLIFDRYYRARKHQDPAFGHTGTGLGLAIVKRILDLHQCRIEVTSELGAGTCIQFSLPRQDVAS